MELLVIELIVGLFMVTMCGAMVACVLKAAASIKRSFQELKEKK